MPNICGPAIVLFSTTLWRRPPATIALVRVASPPEPARATRWVLLCTYRRSENSMSSVADVEPGPRWAHDTLFQDTATVGNLGSMARCASCTLITWIAMQFAPAQESVNAFAKNDTFP